MQQNLGSTCSVMATAAARLFHALPSHGAPATALRACPRLTGVRAQRIGSPLTWWE